MQPELHHHHQVTLMVSTVSRKSQSQKLDLVVSYFCIVGRQEEKKRKKQYNTKLMTCNLGMIHIQKCICTQHTHTQPNQI